MRGLGLWVWVCVVCELFLGDVHLGLFRADGELFDDVYLPGVEFLPDERVGAAEASTVYNGVYGEEWHAAVSLVSGERGSEPGTAARLFPFYSD